MIQFFQKGWNHQLLVVHTGNLTCWTQKLEVWKMIYPFQTKENFRFQPFISQGVKEVISQLHFPKKFLYMLHTHLSCGGLHSFLHVHFLTTTGCTSQKFFMKEICLPDGDLQPDPTVTWAVKPLKIGRAPKENWYANPSFSGGKKRLVSFRERVNATNIFGCSRFCRYKRFSLVQNTTTGWWFQIFFFKFRPYLGEMIQLNKHIFQMGWFNHQLDIKFLQHRVLTPASVIGHPGRWSPEVYTSKWRNKCSNLH